EMVNAMPVEWVRCLARMPLVDAEAYLRSLESLLPHPAAPPGVAAALVDPKRRAFLEVHIHPRHGIQYVGVAQDPGGSAAHRVLTHMRVMKVLFLLPLHPHKRKAMRWCQRVCQQGIVVGLRHFKYLAHKTDRAPKTAHFHPKAFFLALDSAASWDLQQPHIFHPFASAWDARAVFGNFDSCPNVPKLAARIGLIFSRTYPMLNASTISPAVLQIADDETCEDGTKSTDGNGMILAALVPPKHISRGEELWADQVPLQVEEGTAAAGAVAGGAGGAAGGAGGGAAEAAAAEVAAAAALELEEPDEEDEEEDGVEWDEDEVDWDAVNVAVTQFEQERGLLGGGAAAAGDAAMGGAEAGGDAEAGAEGGVYQGIGASGGGEESDGLLWDSASLVVTQIEQERGLVQGVGGGGWGAGAGAVGGGGGGVGGGGEGRGGGGEIGGGAGRNAGGGVRGEGAGEAGYEGVRPAVWQMRGFLGGMVVKGTLLVVQQMPSYVRPGVCILLRSSMVKVAPPLPDPASNLAALSTPILPPSRHSHQSRQLHQTHQSQLQQPGSQPQVQQQPSQPPCQPSGPLFSIEVNETTKEALPARLNRTVIALLERGGVPAHLFLDLVCSAAAAACAPVTEHKAAMKLLQESMRGHKRVVDPRDVQLACRMLLSSVDLRDAFIQRVLWRLQYAHIQGLASGKVEVPHCYYLMGVADPSNTLAPNEIVVLLHDGPVSGPCLVYRPPSLLVSNIRRLSAVHSPAVLSLLPRSSRFCVIFSTRGQRSVTDCMGGGDLDGDRFLVIMHPQIVSAFRERPLPPACPSVSEPLPPLPCDPAVRERALIRCWLDGELYNRFHMGTAGNLHLAHMDRSPLGPDSPECLQLAALYELALDSAKTGHVVEGLGRYKVESYPHFMRSSTRTCYHSTSLMGQMFDAVQEERRKHVVDSGAMTPDVGIALLASKDPNGAASRAKWEGLLGQYEVQVRDVVRQRTTLLGGARRARLAAIENKFRQELEQGWASSFEQPFRPQHMLYEAASLYMVGYETARRELALQVERRAEALAGCGAGGEAGGDVEMRSSGMTGDGDVAGEDEWGGAGGDEEEEGVGDNEGDDDEVMEYDEGEDMEDEDLADCTNRATLACRFVWHVGEEALCEAKSRLCLRTGNGVGGGWGVENGGFEGVLMTMEKQAFADIMGLSDNGGIGARDVDLTTMASTTSLVGASALAPATAQVSRGKSQRQPLSLTNTSPVPISIVPTSQSAILRAAAPSSLAPCQASKEGKWGVQLPWEKKNDEEEEEEEVQGKSILGVKLPWKREAVVEEEEEEPQSKTILGQLGTMRWSLNPKDDKQQQQEEEVEEKGKNSFFDQIGTMRLTLQVGAAEVEEEEVVEEEEEEDESSSIWRQWYVSITGFPFPLRPFLSRKTYRYEVDRNSIWCFEQEQGLGFSNVTTNVRMTVIKLKSGGLFVHAPIAPTVECLKLLKDLNLPVEHIVLPTFAYEHKVFAGPFARAFPKARTWVAPRQWSWPINLPLPFLGLFGGTVLAEDGPKPDEWPEEIDYKIFASPEVGIGPYVEIAFFHRPSRTLLLTDAVIVVPREPPQVVRPDALLDAARSGLAVRVLSAGRDVPDVEVEDTEEFRTLGWQRMVLQILFFGPGNLLEPEESFERICGKLVVSPVVKTLVFDKVPAQALAWINSITSDWAFTRIIPCHFSSPIAATPADLRKTFAFLQDLLPPGSSSPFPVIPSLPAVAFPSFGSLFGRGKEAEKRVEVVTEYAEDDLATLSSLDSTLVSLGVVKRTGDP
ncbi:unnamed protein product, partial [Closterium sp. Naga37s-1]